MGWESLGVLLLGSVRGHAPHLSLSLSKSVLAGVVMECHLPVAQSALHCCGLQSTWGSGPCG